MSHFAVVVVSKSAADVARLLAPFDENLEVSEYERPVTDLYFGYLKKAHKSDDINVIAAKCNAKQEPMVVRDGKLYELTTRNPQGYWDWNSIGGRWMGYFKGKGLLGKPGAFDNEPDEAGRCDQGRKGDIDFAAVRDFEGNKAGALWDTVHALVKPHGFPPTFHDLMKARAPDFDEDSYGWNASLAAKAVNEPGISDEDRSTRLEAARASFNAIRNACTKEIANHPASLALRKHDDKLWFMDDLADLFDRPREQNVKEARDSACVPFAVVLDPTIASGLTVTPSGNGYVWVGGGSAQRMVIIRPKDASAAAPLTEPVWLAKGKMGWWGNSKDTEEQAAWCERVTALFDAIPDDAILTAVDCHC